MNEPSLRLARWVHFVLLIGVVAAGLLMAVGLVIAVAGEQPRPVVQPHLLSSLPSRLADGNGIALIELGLLVLILTPVARVAVLTIGWLVGGDRRFAAVAASVLGLLALSVWLGLG
jgi:uncharacterized membrane protein